MSNAQPRFTNAEIARLGREIYESQVRSEVEAENMDRVIAIDIHTGEYALGDTALSAVHELRSRQPNAEIWLTRVGRRTLRRIGGFGSEAGT